jgi:hypothetical protein
MTGPHTAEIQRLIETYHRLAASAENQRRLRCWQREAVARDQWHGRPRNAALLRHGEVPITVDLQNVAWLQFFPLDLAATYQDSRAYLRFFLQRRIEQFRCLADDTPLDGVVPIYLGTVFEPSLLGVAGHFFPDKDPVIGSKPVIASRADLPRLDPVDFRQAGMMPVAHRLFEEIREMAGDGLTVVFPEWLRGPLGVAQYVRGYEDMLADLAGDPALAGDILGRVTEARRRWFEDRARFLGEPIPAGSLFDDEVDANVISPRHFRDLVMPCERTLAEFHGRISYWHSCGNTGPLAGDIRGIGRIDMLDVSAATDLEQVLRATAGKTPTLEIRFHPLRDLLEASPQHATNRIARALRLCREHGVGTVTLRCSAIMPHRNPADDLVRVRQWIDTARRLVEGGLEK